MTEESVPEDAEDVAQGPSPQAETWGPKVKPTKSSTEESEEEAGNPDGLKGDWAAIVASRVRGDTLEQTALAAGVSVSTVQRRLADPVVQKLIREHRDRRLVEILDRQSELVRKSAVRLEEWIDSNDPSIGLRAMALAYSNTARLTNVVDIVSRLAEIEAQLELDK